MSAFPQLGTEKIQEFPLGSVDTMEDTRAYAI